LGAKIEALEPDQIAARGMDAQTPAAYDRATGSILLNMGLLRKVGSPLADKLFEHEIIHHADIQGARARHAASGSPLPFEELLKARNQAIIDDLAASPVGRKFCSMPTTLIGAQATKTSNQSPIFPPSPLIRGWPQNSSAWVRKPDAAAS
jgi:hypothetical protein